MATPLPLEGDGLIENLFYFLWSKDDFGAGPRIHIPHTVLYRFAQPTAWYFTSLRSGKIKRKTKANLTNVQIEHEFTKKRSASDIVAYYIYIVNSSHSSDGICSDDAAARTTIEYFDVDALRDFLYHRDKPHGGMLQKFVLPKGTSNATIRAIWSPKICLLERRVNIRNVHDKRYSVYERSVTFDGADVHSRPEPVRGAMLPGEVQLLCEHVVEHVTQVSYHKYRIARMVLHLKSDADDKLWLLWSSSLRLVNTIATDATPLRPLDIVHDAQVPTFAMQHARQSSTSSTATFTAVSSNDSDSQEHRMGFARCTSCGQHVEQTKFLATTYKAVLEHFQRFLRFARQHVNENAHAAIEWPPDARLVQAAGGVGFGILESTGRDRSSKRSSVGASPNVYNASSSALLTRKELVIPPVIQYLHPTFSVDDFERHRYDPLFLHKPVAVCESCCLVYADYTTSSLEVNSIRQSAPALLRPHCARSDATKRLDPLDAVAVALASNAASPAAQSMRMKPPASAWQPVASVSKTRSKPHRQTSRSTLSSLPSAPQLPQRIDSFDDVQSAHFADTMLGSGSSGGVSGSASVSALQQREETFFRELGQQKDLERGHPLHHMLESATRLAASKQQPSAKQQRLAALRLSGASGMDMTLGKSRSVGALPELLEQQLADAKKASTKSPYSIVLRLREPSTTTLTHEPSDSERQVNQYDSSVKQEAKTSKRRAGGKRLKASTTKAKRRSGHTGNNVDGDDNNNESDDAQQQQRHMRFVSVREQQASELHQDFLLAALSQAQAQMEHMESLASLLPDLETLAPVSPASSAHDNSEDDESENESERDGDAQAAINAESERRQSESIDGLGGGTDERDDTELHGDIERHGDSSSLDGDDSDNCGATHSDGAGHRKGSEQQHQDADDAVLRPNIELQEAEPAICNDDVEYGDDAEHHDGLDERDDAAAVAEADSDDIDQHGDDEFCSDTEQHSNIESRGGIDQPNGLEPYDDTEPYTNTEPYDDTKPYDDSEPYTDVEPYADTALYDDTEPYDDSEPLVGGTAPHDATEQLDASTAHDTFDAHDMTESSRDDIERDADDQHSHDEGITPLPADTPSRSSEAGEVEC